MLKLLSEVRDWLAHARLWVKAGRESQGTVEAAATALYLLNGYVHGNRAAKRDIYLIKNLMIRALYEGGYCARVQCQLHTLPCYGEPGRECDEHCPKCGGTSVYKTASLYRFTFVVGNKVFCWHQPENQIEPPIEPGIRFDFDRSILVTDAPVALTDEGVAHFMYVCWWYLWKQGYRPSLGLTRPLKLIRTDSPHLVGRYWAGLCYARNGTKATVRWPSFPTWRPQREKDWTNHDWIVVARDAGRWGVKLFGKSHRWGE